MNTKGAGASESIIPMPQLLFAGLFIFLPFVSLFFRTEDLNSLTFFNVSGPCYTLCEMELYEQFKQSAQALELLHERKMWNEQKPFCLSAAS